MTFLDKKHTNTRITQQLKLFSFELIVILTVSIVAVLIFFWISLNIKQNKIAPFDENVYYLIRYYGSPLLDRFMIAATFFGNRQFVVFPLAALIIHYIFIKPNKLFTIKVTAVAIGSIATNLLLKQMYGRARPALDHMVEVNNFSFPSGHAMFSASFYGLLMYIAYKEIKSKTLRTCCYLLLGLLVIFIGISRIYLGVHYASDVFAGFIAGFLWLAVALLAIKLVEPKLKK